MRSWTSSTTSLLALSSILSSSITSAQFLQSGSGQLPPCAQQCTQLQQAQTLCVPPAAPQIQKPCFCQSALLVQLKTTPDAVCAQNCDAGSRQQIQQWYNSYCANPNEAVEPANTAPAKASGTSSASPAATSNADPNQDIGYSRNQGTWWDNHSRWIAMIIVLVIAFAIIIGLGIWWKKRHDRRVNRGTTTPLPVGWGPNSNPHSYGESGAVLVHPRDAAEAEKQGQSATAAHTVGKSSDLGTATRQSKRGSKGRLSKLMGR